MVLMPRRCGRRSKSGRCRHCRCRAQVEPIRIGIMKAFLPTFPFPVHRFLLESVASGAAPGTARAATGRQLAPRSSLNFEMARVDLRRSGRPYRFLYSCSVPVRRLLLTRPRSCLEHQHAFLPAVTDTAVMSSTQHGAPWFAGVCKLDMVKGEVVGTWVPANNFPGEPIFVPRPGGKAEDDGVVLSVVLDGTRVTYLRISVQILLHVQIPFAVEPSCLLVPNGRSARLLTLYVFHAGAAQLSFLLVLDGLAFLEVARAPLPFAVPFGFHGDFFAAEL